MDARAINSREKADLKYPRNTYIIGDVQGCYRELQELLELIQFDSTKDRLGFVGDLVNRGPNSLEVLRFLKSLSSPLIVLGNHDLYLLILGYGLMPEDSYEHTLHAVLQAPDKLELLEWLRHCPLIRYEKSLSAVLVHAGLPPQWNIKESILHAEEISTALKGPHYLAFLKNLFGNEPSQWKDDLEGQDRLRYICNAFTRMRFCDAKGHLDLESEGKTNQAPSRFRPWFEWRNPQEDNVDIVFGHWAALNGQSSAPHTHALDTGCAWGYKLTAINLKTKERFSVPCQSALRM
ncbi:bis(5'-nucleosyl)-tetraphosphatase (symmetrical) [Coxiella burnetii]|uniref:Bis(5'-nucleosyl)-tetraphosphatase, symmetrical n=2 Tax=Coxiella burnetii TaxID=777 RepID=APAH_COXBN|nr:symmetrical bis(5'-nucleosyl)-tetraphosphatase [Coxiella burnetii]A9KH04.1 RecName: Full=Bis(5'-nucleosyl)-tetraphosphatase, symmetrical; AltName: Full=Ap4A hydrolase; AltName: Full=Diadenosine 5',5'''-P1,P4-tetraphosphate pyrophosphohydrolase; AltName: Full=Diadenosine tetraphosphatase [Coxiella burnetii Dugway 5J108-111]ABS77008.1 bis(5'-nucleosyl)-tetraphosphatase, symmetrical [Coxiella burnetii Dugway 5J108-111]OYK79547.1 bis(5'-nucleosyl)-tetraphosphatase (symmetrical) [Coxiella burnetii